MVEKWLLIMHSVTWNNIQPTLHLIQEMTLRKITLLDASVFKATQDSAQSISISGLGHWWHYHRQFSRWTRFSPISTHQLQSYSPLPILDVLCHAWGLSPPDICLPLLPLKRSRLKTKCLLAYSWTSPLSYSEAMVEWLWYKECSPHGGHVLPHCIAEDKPEQFDIQNKGASLSLRIILRLVLRTLAIAWASIFARRAIPLASAPKLSGDQLLFMRSDYCKVSDQRLVFASFV